MIHDQESEIILLNDLLRSPLLSMPVYNAHWTGVNFADAELTTDRKSKQKHHEPDN